MKKSHFSFLTLILFLLFCTSISFAQKNTQTLPKSNIPSTTINQNLKLDKSKITLKDQIPFFNVKPISGNLKLSPSAIQSTSKLNTVGTIPLGTVVVSEASVNGIMSARDPYINSYAYLEFLSGDVDPSSNEVGCKCGGGLTYVKLNLRATAGKRYMVSTTVSPKGNSFGLSMFTSGFVHNAGVNSPKQTVDVILSSETTGNIELWMQCSDPNSGRRAWKFHSMKVQQVD